MLYQADQIAGQVSTHACTQPCGDRAIGDECARCHRLGKQAGSEDLHQPVRASPFYKPIHEDLRVQTVYDTALVFTKGAQELHDAVKTLEAMSARPATPQQQEELLQLQQNVQMLTEQLNETVDATGRGTEASGREWPGASDPLMPAGEDRGAVTFGSLIKLAPVSGR